MTTPAARGQRLVDPAPTSFSTWTTYDTVLEVTARLQGDEGEA